MVSLRASPIVTLKTIPVLAFRGAFHEACIVLVFFRINLPNATPAIPMSMGLFRIIKREKEKNLH